MYQSIYPWNLVHIYLSISISSYYQSMYISIKQYIYIYIYIYMLMCMMAGECIPPKIYTPFMISSKN